MNETTPATWKVEEDATFGQMRRKVRGGLACLVASFALELAVFGWNFVRGAQHFAGPFAFLVGIGLAIVGWVLLTQARLVRTTIAHRTVDPAGARSELAVARSYSVDGAVARSFGWDGVIRTYRGEGTAAPQDLADAAQRRRRIVPILGDVGLLRAVWPGFVSFPITLVLLAGVGKMIHETPERIDYVMVTIFAAMAALTARGFLRGVARFAPRELHVGDDGLLVVTGGERRFVPYRFVTGVRLEGDAVVITRHGGTEERFRPAARDGEGIAKDVAADIEARAQRSAEQTTASTLDQGQRTADRWRIELDEATRGGYREQALDPDELAAAVNDPASPIDRRVGAMYALGVADAARAEEELAHVREALADEEAHKLLAKAAKGEIDEKRLGKIQRR